MNKFITILSLLLFASFAYSASVTFNVFQETGVDYNLTGVNIDCNSNSPNYDLNNQSSPFTIDFNSGDYSCTFSKSEWDSNTIEFTVADSNSNIVVYLDKFVYPKIIAFTNSTASTSSTSAVAVQTWSFDANFGGTTSATIGCSFWASSDTNFSGTWNIQSSDNGTTWTTRGTVSRTMTSTTTAGSVYVAGTAYNITDGTRYVRLTHQVSAAGPLITNDVSCHLRTNRDQNNFLMTTAVDARAETTINTSTFNNLGAAFNLNAPYNGFLYFVGNTTYRKTPGNASSESSLRLLKNSSALTEYPRYVGSGTTGVGAIAEFFSDANSGQTITSQYQGLSATSQTRFALNIQKYFLNQEAGEFEQRSLAGIDNNSRDWNQIACAEFSHTHTRDIEVVAVVPHKSDSANDLFEIYFNAKGSIASGYDVNSSIAKRSFGSANQNGIMIHQYLFMDINSNDVNICIYGKSNVGKITITGGNVVGITTNATTTVIESVDLNSSIIIHDLNFYKVGDLTQNVNLDIYSDVNVLFDFNAIGNAIDINSAKVFYRAPYDDQNCFGVIRDTQVCSWKEEDSLNFFTGTNTDTNNYYFLSRDDDDHVFKPWVYNADPDAFEAKDGNFALYGSNRWIKSLHTFVPIGPNYFYNFSFAAYPPVGPYDLFFYDCNHESSDPANDSGCIFIDFGYDTPVDPDTFYSIKYNTNDFNQVSGVTLNPDGNHWTYVNCPSCTISDNWKIIYIAQNTNIDRIRNWTSTAGVSNFTANTTTHNFHYHYLIPDQDNFAEWYVTLDNLAGTTFTSEIYREGINTANLPPTPDGFNSPLTSTYYKGTLDINWNVLDPDNDLLLCDFNIYDSENNLVYFSTDKNAVPNNNILCIDENIDISNFTSGTYTLKGISREYDTNFNFARGSTVIFGIDNNYPLTTIIPDLNNETRNTSATFSLSCLDINGVGCATTQYRLNGGEFLNYTGLVNVTNSGLNTLDFNSTDSLGNLEPLNTITFTIDTNTVYVSTTSDYNLGGWQNTLQTINFTCDANDGHSCVDTNYNLDNSGWVDGNAVTISTDGNHILQFRSMDDLNRIEATNTIYVAIDLSAPTFLIDNNNTWLSSPFNILFNDTNFDVSGKDSAQVSINDGSWIDLNLSGNMYSAQISEDGNNKVEYELIDNATNSITGTTYALLDTTLPTTTYSGCSSGWNTTSPTITFSCTDPSSPCLHTYRKINAGAFVDSTTLSITTDENHLITYYSTDSAGNTEMQKSFYCAVDQNAPVIDSILEINTFYTHDFNVEFKQITFGPSGFGSATYRLNNGTWTNMTTDDNNDFYALINVDGNNELDYNITDLAGNSISGTEYAILEREDTDEDGNLNVDDPLYFTESEVEVSGIGTLNILIDGNAPEELFSGVVDVNFYDGTTPIMYFDFNLDRNNLDLSKIIITKTVNSILVDLNGQLQSDRNKTLYLENNDFISLCVKNAPITSISEISSSCNGVDEYNFTTCLDGNYSTAGINCTLTNGIIKVENLRYSGILGTSQTQTSPSSSCTPLWNCSPWSKCVDEIQNRICTQINTCTLIFGKPIETQSCTIQDTNKETEQDTKQIDDQSKIDANTQKPSDEIVCPAMWDPVCGVDGKTYGNNCEVNASHIEVAYKGECELVVPPIVEKTNYDNLFLIGLLILSLILVVAWIILIKNKKKRKKNNLGLQN